MIEVSRIEKRSIAKENGIIVEDIDEEN